VAHWFTLHVSIRSTTVIASIAWQLVASAFPLAFLSNPVTYILLRICLTLEATGICNGAWVIADIHRKAAGFQKDEIYVGTAQDRANMGKADSVGHVSEVGHLGGSAFPANHMLPTHEYEADYLSQRAKIVANIKDLRTLMDDAGTSDERAVYESSLNHELAALKRINGQQQGDFASRVSGVKDLEAGTDDDQTQWFLIHYCDYDVVVLCVSSDNDFLIYCDRRLCEQVIYIILFFFSIAYFPFCSRLFIPHHWFCEALGVAGERLKICCMNGEER